MNLDFLRDSIAYDPETGLMHWKKPRTNRLKPGTPITSKNADGYICVYFDGKRRSVHRLAWFYVYGKWPDGQIDHKNCIRDDNRIANLRDCTFSQNKRNMKKTKIGSTSKYIGVSWDAAYNSWKAKGFLNSKSKYLGRFKNEDAAAAKYDWFIHANFPEFGRTNGEVFVL